MKPNRQQIEASLTYARGSDYDPRTWSRHEQTLLDAGLCPDCAQSGQRIGVLRLEPDLVQCRQCDGLFKTGVANEPGMEVAPDATEGSLL